jgi:hypothetical protein
LEYDIIKYIIAFKALFLGPVYKMNKRFLAIIAVSLATLIYGINYTIAKEVMPLYVKPYAFIFYEFLEPP